MSATAVDVRRRYSPTALRVLAEHCPRALDHYQDRAVRARDVFSAGIVAHECLEAIGLEARTKGKPIEQLHALRICDAVVERLLDGGRDGESDPIGPEAAFEGRDLAVRWNDVHPLAPHAVTEQSVAFDRDWKKVGWDDDSARFRLRLDLNLVVDETDEEGYGTRYIEAIDYKTSWHAGAPDLWIDGRNGPPSLQMRAQAVAIWIAVERAGTDFVRDVNGIRLGIGNLRTLGITYRELHPWSEDDEDGDLIIQWRDDIAQAMGVADAQAARGDRPARPGAGCIGCPYTLRCEAGREFLHEAYQLSDASDPIRLARTWAVSKSHTDELTKLTQARLKDVGAVEVDEHGRRIGYVGKDRRVLHDDAIGEIVALWQARAGRDEGDEEMSASATRGLLQALKLTPGNVKALAGLLHGRGEKAEREELIGQLTEIETKPQFGSHAAAPVDGASP